MMTGHAWFDGELMLESFTEVPAMQRLPPTTRDAATQAAFDLPADEASAVQLIFENSREHALILCDRHGRICGWLMGAEQLLGYTRDEVMGQHVSLLYADVDIGGESCPHAMEAAICNGSNEYDCWLRTSAGRQIWAMGTLNRLTSDSGDSIGFGTFLRDRTDLKVRLERADRRMAQLEASQDAKDRFVARLSHELRSPLMAIANAASVLLAGQLGRADHEAVEIIERQVGSLRRMVDDLLDASRLATGKLHMRRELSSLNEIVQSAVKTCQPAIDARLQRLELTSCEAEPMVECDPQRLQQVFINLIQNSAKFTPAHGRIRIDVCCQKNELLVRVQDSGVGIDTECLPRIFEMFSQSVSPQQPANEGLGIGLAVAREIVTMHDGRIDVHSEGLGRGSEFTVRLPGIQHVDRNAAEKFDVAGHKQLSQITQLPSA